MNVKRKVEKIRATTAALEKAVREARADIAKVEDREELTAEARRAAVQAREQELREEVDAIEASGREAMKEIEAAAPAPIAVDPLEAMRIWGRLERELNAGADPSGLAARLASERKRTDIAVLTQELPSYMRAEGLSDLDVRARLTEIAMSEGPLLDKSETEYRACVVDAENAAHHLKINAGTVRMDGTTAELLLGATTAENIDLKD